MKIVEEIVAAVGNSSLLFISRNEYFSAEAHNGGAFNILLLAVFFPRHAMLPRSDYLIATCVCRRFASGGAAQRHWDESQRQRNRNNNNKKIQQRK